MEPAFLAFYSKRGNEQSDQFSAGENDCEIACYRKSLPHLAKLSHLFRVHRLLFRFGKKEIFHSYLSQQSADGEKRDAKSGNRASTSFHLRRVTHAREETAATRALRGRKSRGDYLDYS